MNKTLIKVFIFTVGAAVGSAVTWKVVKTKYEQIAQEEIDSVKNEYRSLMETMRNKLKESATYDEDQESDEIVEEDDCYPDDDESERELIAYHALANRYRGARVDNSDENDEEGDMEDDGPGFPYIDPPYVISPDDFACSPPGYNAQPLDYYSDGILADAWGVKLDIDEIIGEDSLEHFGEYTDDIVYVRNERTETDYEVTRDPRSYREAMQINPDFQYK